ncbi:MAG: S1C family serine protease, partial [Rhodospirillaceae bacterium]
LTATKTSQSAVYLYRRPSKDEPGVVRIHPAGTRATPIRFGRLEGRLRHGAEIGRYTWGILCKPPFSTITWQTGQRLVTSHEYATVFYDTLTNQGFSVAGDPGRLYDVEEDVARAEMLVSGQTDEVAIDLCRRYDWWLGGYSGYTGAGIIRVNWTVYNRLERRVVYQTTTTGTGQVDDATPDAREIIMERAFAGAVAQLGTNEGFRRSVFQPVAHSTKPALEAPMSPSTPPPTLAPRPSLPRPTEPRPDPELPPDLGPDFNPTPPIGGSTGGLSGGMSADPASSGAETETRLLESEPEALSDQPALGTVPMMRVAALPTRSGPMTANAEDVVDATVVIATGSGSGSGFFVAEDKVRGGGWILTNAHVVGDAERVRVSTSNRRARIGTVSRRHRIRDVALVHVEGAVPAVVSIRSEPVMVGEDVYAMGAPLGTHNRSTLSKGIVSRLTGQPGSLLPWIQSDVMIQHGSSGGPLVDGSGNVVGVCVAALGSGPTDTSLGINYFIPIDDALQKLKIEIAGKP